MSPEQARGDALDYRSDIFSIGIVLFEALTATPLYDETDDAALMQRVQTADVRSPSTYRDDIPPELEAIVMRALSRHARDRFNSTLEMGRALADFLITRDRSFTKVDLADFLAALFRTATMTDPELSTGSYSRNNPDETLPPMAMRAALTPDPTIEQPTRAHAAPRTAAVEDDEDIIITSHAALPHHVSLDQPTFEEVPLDPLMGVTTEQPDAAANDADTRQLSLEQIRKVNEAMARARAEKASAGVVKPALPNVGGPRTAAVRVLTPAPVRKARENRAVRRRQRDKRMKLALGAVVLANVALVLAIVWLLLHPVELPPLSSESLRGGSDEVHEQWVRSEGPTLELGVELATQEPGVVGDLADLHKLLVRAQSTEDQPRLL